MKKGKFFVQFLFFLFEFKKMKVVVPVFFRLVFLWTGHSSGWMVDYATG
jgi:hypothetical protein